MQGLTFGKSGLHLTLGNGVFEWVIREDPEALTVPDHGLWLTGSGEISMPQLVDLFHKLTSPALLFFWMGLLALPLGIQHLRFPKEFAGALVMLMLMAIGWRGGGEMATLESTAWQELSCLAPTGFLTNTAIGFLAYFLLKHLVQLRKKQAAIVAGYYGSDSAGTFMTCVGILKTAKIGFAAYMPVLLTIMEIPGCVVALLLVRMIHDEQESAANGSDSAEPSKKSRSFLTPLLKVVTEKEVYLLLAGLLVGFIAHKQGSEKDVKAVGLLLDDGFYGLLCLFLFQMGTEASARISEAFKAGWRFVVFAIAGPVLFASIGVAVMHSLSYFILHRPFLLGNYVLFGVLCGAASYIALPAVHSSLMRNREDDVSLALPLSASLGITFTFNVTLGIPLYLKIAQLITTTFPVV